MNLVWRIVLEKPRALPKRFSVELQDMIEYANLSLPIFIMFSVELQVMIEFLNLPLSLFIMFSVEL